MITSSNRIERNKNEFSEQMYQSLKDLQNDALRFDNGDIFAIKRSSVTLRSLFYDKKSSHSLLNLMNLTNKRFPTLTNKFSEKDNINYGTLHFIRLPKQPPFTGYYDTMLCTDTKVKSYLPFEKWWKQPILKFCSLIVTRESLIKIEANQDGGAHFDSKVNKNYKNLQNGSTGFRMFPQKLNKFIFENYFGGDQSKDINPQNINLGLTRQIVHETLLAFNDEYKLHYKPNFDTNLKRRLNNFIFQFKSTKN